MLTSAVHEPGLPSTSLKSTNMTDGPRSRAHRWSWCGTAGDVCVCVRVTVTVHVSPAVMAKAGSMLLLLLLLLLLPPEALELD